MLNQIDKFMQQGHFQEALDKIDIKLKKSETPDLLLKKSCILRLLGKINQAMDIINDLLNLDEIEKDYKLKLDIYLEKLYLFWKLYSVNEAYEFSKKIKKIMDAGNPEEYQIAKYHHLMGNILGGLGDYYYSIQNSMKSLDYYRKINRPDMEALIMNNLGFINSLIGELKLSEEYLLESLSISIDLGIQLDIARTLNNLGMLYHQMGQFDRSEDYLLQSLTIQEEAQNELEMSYSYFELIRLNIAKSDINTALKYYGQLNLLKIQSNYGIIDLRAKLGHAILLMTESNYESKVQAVNILTKIITGKVYHHRYSLSALKYLAYIKIEELEIFQDKKILIELESIIEDLIYEGEIQNSVMAIVESNLLLSKIYLLKGEVDKSKDLLNRIKKLSDDHNLEKLSGSISSLYDHLQIQLPFWERVSKNSEFSFKERIDQSEIVFLLRSLQRNRIDYLSIENEVPLLFLILAETGGVKFILKFDANEIQEQLIGAFISAINSFFTMALSSGSSIERVTSGEHTLIIKSENNFTYVYIFKGQSFYALEKLDAIVSKLLESEEYLSIKKKWKKVPGRDLPLSPDLIEMIRNTINSNINEI